jgi:hypothetical protein
MQGLDLNSLFNGDVLPDSSEFTLESNPGRIESRTRIRMKWCTTLRISILRQNALSSASSAY